MVRMQRVFCTINGATIFSILTMRTCGAPGCARLKDVCWPLLVWKSAEAVQLMVSADLRALVQQRLAMFILRSKVKLIDAHVRLICVGLAGDIGRCLKRIFPILPDEVNGK